MYFIKKVRHVFAEKLNTTRYVLKIYKVDQ